MAYALNDSVDPRRVRLCDMRTRSKSYVDGEIINTVEFHVAVPEIPGKRYTVAVPYLWGVGWQLDFASCSPLFPIEFHQDALTAISAGDLDDRLSMDVQQNCLSLLTL